jgi:hypothetical protein
MLAGKVEKRSDWEDKGNFPYDLGEERKGSHGFIIKVRIQFPPP